MVREAPSAQYIGLEFVSQYYAILNEAPDYLHRFYNDKSSFVHGGVEKPMEERPPVVGQEEIREKIKSLKFQHCHANIRQVDSQPTVGNAFVVQVVGEFSNNRQSMRRFMQTFTLVQRDRSPDGKLWYYIHNDIFRYQDEVFHDLDGGVDSSSTQPASSQKDAIQDIQQEAEVEEAVPEDVVAATQQNPVLSNGTGQMETEDEPAKAIVPVPAEAQLQPQEAPKPVSWAEIVSQRPAHLAATMPVPQQPAARPKAAPSKPAVDAGQPKMGDAKPQRPRRQPRRGQRLPDANQLFVGKIPLGIEENELKEFFEKEFGKVLEVRINRKSNGNRDVPNFGFVVFQSPETVQKVLQMRPILLRGDIRLNVEKKQSAKQGGRPGSGTRRGGRGDGQGMMGGRDDQGDMGPRIDGNRRSAGGPPCGAQGAGGRGFSGRR